MILITFGASIFCIYYRMANETTSERSSAAVAMRASATNDGLDDVDV